MSAKATSGLGMDQASSAAGDDAGAAVPPVTPADVKAFLDALGSLLRDTVVRFEDTVERITDMFMSSGGRADRDLIVTLQNFDLLNQEFAALGEALALYASMTSKLGLGDEDRRQLGRDVIAKISVADLKERFLRAFDGDAVDQTANSIGEEKEF
jgi:hypothetical protein